MAKLYGYCIDSDGFHAEEFEVQETDKRYKYNGDGNMFGRTVVLKNELGVAWCSSGTIVGNTAPLSIYYAKENTEVAVEALLKALNQRQEFFTKQMFTTFDMLTHMGCERLKYVKEGE